MSDAVVFQVSGGNCDCTSIASNVHRFLNERQIAFTHSFGQGKLPTQYLFFPIPENIDQGKFKKELDEFKMTHGCSYDIFFYPKTSKEKVVGFFRKNKGIFEHVSKMIGKDTLTEILQMLAKAAEKSQGY